MIMSGMTGRTICDLRTPCCLSPVIVLSGFLQQLLLSLFLVIESSQCRIITFWFSVLMCRHIQSSDSEARGLAEAIAETVIPIAGGVTPVED